MRQVVASFPDSSPPPFSVIFRVEDSLMLFKNLKIQCRELLVDALPVFTILNRYRPPTQSGRRSCSGGNNKRKRLDNSVTDGEEYFPADPMDIDVSALDGEGNQALPLPAFKKMYGVVSSDTFDQVEEERTVGAARGKKGGGDIQRDGGGIQLDGGEESSDSEEEEEDDDEGMTAVEKLSGTSFALTSFLPCLSVHAFCVCLFFPKLMLGARPTRRATTTTRAHHHLLLLLLSLLPLPGRWKPRATTTASR